MRVAGEYFGVLVFHDTKARFWDDDDAKCRRWLLDAFEVGGFEVEMGPRLLSTFLAAGLPSPQMIAAARVEGGAHTFAHEYLAETLRCLLPLMERLGITTAEELDVDTLAERLRGGRKLRLHDAAPARRCVGAHTCLRPRHSSVARSGKNDDEQYRQ